MSPSAKAQGSDSHGRQLETPPATDGAPPKTTAERARRDERSFEAGAPGVATPTTEDLDRWLQQVRGWFFELPSAGRVTVLALAIVLGFSLLRTVLEVVTSLVSLALLLLVAYVVYKIFIAGDWPSNDRQ